MGFFGKKRLTEPVRNEVEPAMRPSGSVRLRVIEREYANGEVLYYPQEKFASSWIDVTYEGFDTASEAKDYDAEIYGNGVISERVVD